MNYQYATDSLACLDALPSTIPLDCSAELGWKSLLVRRSQGTGSPEPYDTLTTPDHKLVVVLRGEVDVEIYKRGLWRRAVYRPGTSGLSVPGEPDRLRVRLRASTQSFEKLHVFIPHGVIEEAAEHFRRPGQRIRKLSSMTLTDQALGQIARTLVSGMQQRAPDFLAEAASHWLAVQLLTRQDDPWLAGELRQPGSITDARLRRALDFMSANMHAQLALEAIAAEAAVSKFHFIRLFRERLGVTPMQHLSELRLATAAQMLRTTDLPVDQVAKNCGFFNAAHFSNAFRKRFGASPMKFRANA